MSDVSAVREVLSKIDSLRSKVREAKVTLRELKEDAAIIKVHHLSVNREISKDLRPGIVDGVESQIQLWEIEIQKLESRVSLK